MRLGLLIYGSLDTLTGGYLYDRLMVEHWREQGEDVTLFSLPWRSYPHHLTDNFRYSFFRQLQSAQLDCLIQDELNHPSVIWLNRQLKKVVNYPILSLIHLVKCFERRPAWGNRLFGWFERHYFATVDGFIYNSDHSRRLVEGMLATDKPGVVVYPGKDHLPGRMPAQKEAFSPTRLLFIGNVAPRKGLHTLLAALAQLHRPDWQLTVVGSLQMEPVYVRHIHQLIATYQLGQQVQLVGAIPNQQIADYLAKSDLFVLPSQYEGFGIVYVEALGFGLPVVASTVGAAAEIVRHGQEGFLVEPEDVAGIAGTLRHLLDNPTLRQTMSLAARARYEQFPTWAEGAETIKKFARSLAELKFKN